MKNWNARLPITKVTAVRSIHREDGRRTPSAPITANTPTSTTRIAPSGVCANSRAKSTKFAPHFRTNTVGSARTVSLNFGHELTYQGSFGRYLVRCKNIESPKYDGNAIPYFVRDQTKNGRRTTVTPPKTRTACRLPNPIHTPSTQIGTARTM